MNRKRRSDAVLLNLPEEKKEKLRAALLGGMSYAEARAWAEKELGVVTGQSAVCEFW